MAENNTEDKRFKYLITMRWYVETDKDLVAGAQESDDKNCCAIVQMGLPAAQPVLRGIMKVMPS